MQCPNCNCETPEGNYCIHCGYDLGIDADTERPETGSSSSEKADADLRQYIQQLSDTVSSLERRLHTLELEHGILSPTPAPQYSIHDKQEKEIIEDTQEPPVPEEAEIAEPVLVTQTVEPAAVPPPPIKVMKEKKPPSALRREWEQILGGNWLARIGVLSIIIGTGFFLKFAFDRNWLGPLGRVLLGVAGGLLLLTGGYAWRKKYPAFSQALSGGGIALLYLSVFAAYASFGLIGIVPAVILLLIVCVVSSLASLKHNSMALAILAVIGAFLAPLLIGVSSGVSAGVSEPGLSVWLIVYTIVVDIGVLFLSTFRNWRWFNLLALTGSAIVFGVWYVKFGEEAGLFASMGSLTVIFLLFNGVTTLFHMIWKQVPGDIDYLFMVANVTLYYGFSYQIFYRAEQAWIGGFTLLLTILYLMVFVLRKKITFAGRFADFALAIGIVLFTVAVLVQMELSVWTVIAWAVEGLVLVWLSFRTNLPRLRIAAYLVFLAMITILGDLNVTGYRETYLPVINGRFLAFLASTMCVYLASLILWRKRDNLSGFETTGGIDYRILFVAGNIFAVWAIAVEVSDFVSSYYSPGEAWPLLFLIVLAGLLVLHYAVWKRPLSILDVIVPAGDAIAFFIIISILSGSLGDWTGLLFLVLAVLYGALARIFYLRRSEGKRYYLIALGIAILSLSVAVPVQFGDSLWTTVAWSAELAVLVWTSFRWKKGLLRYFGYGVSLALVIRLLFFDLPVSMSGFQPVLNERFPAFIAAIAAFFLCSRMMKINGTLLSSIEKASLKVRHIYLIVANCLLLLLVSVETWGYFSTRYNESTLQDRKSIESARNLSLTAVWSVYAIALLIFGIKLRSRSLRLAGLGLFVIPIVKVYVYDVFALEQIYRIFAFTGLGVLLLISGYLYNRYKDAIRGFITEK